MESTSIKHFADQCMALEQRYSSDNYNGRETKTDSLRVTGNHENPVIFTAPHAINHPFSGSLKKADKGTGALCEILACYTFNTSLTAQGHLTTDPQKDENFRHPFRQKLISLLKPKSFVIDVHGMSDKSLVDVELDLGPVPDSCVKNRAEKLRKILESSGFKVSVQVNSSDKTLTAFVQKHFCPAMQISVAERLRNFIRSPEKSSLLIERLITGCEKF